ncbi:unnamed protein product, partial [Heterosigma akashiwo]
ARPPEGGRGVPGPGPAAEPLLDRLQPQHLPGGRPAALGLLREPVHQRPEQGLPLRGAGLLGRRARRARPQGRGAGPDHLPRAHPHQEDPLQGRHPGGGGLQLPDLTAADHPQLREPLLHPRAAEDGRLLCGDPRRQAGVPGS